MNRQPDVVTFGCRLNHFESEVIKNHLKTVDAKDTIVVNTCAVTGEAERQARQKIRRLHKQYPHAKIIATGCSAQINPKAYASLHGVHSVLGNQEKMEAHNYQPGSVKIKVNDIMAIKETAGHLIGSFEGRVRTFIEIQNGCDHRCTFCTIPFGRGQNRSVPMGAIVQQIQHVVNKGCQEVVFTGVDITDYGKDLPLQPTLGQLVLRTLRCVQTLPRLRLSSLDPAEVDQELYHAIATEERLMPHFHISLQSGHDLILKRMKRRHLRQDIFHFCKKVSDIRPGAAFGADLIVGFPTETKAMFDASLSLITLLPLVYLHVFPYSSRPGTPAARMPQVQRTIIKERTRTAIAKGNTALKQWLHQHINTQTNVLIEKNNQGYSTHYMPVYVENDTPLHVGKIYPVRIVAAEDKKLIAKVNTTTDIKVSLKDEV